MCVLTNGRKNFNVEKEFQRKITKKKIITIFMALYANHNSNRNKSNPVDVARAEKKIVIKQERQSTTLRISDEYGNKRNSFAKKLCVFRKYFADEHNHKWNVTRETDIGCINCILLTKNYM